MKDPTKLLADALPELPTKLAKAARYALDNPNRIALDSMRTVSASCGVTSPTMLRLARKVGYENYEEFRADFQHQLLERGFGPRVNALRSHFADEEGGKLGEEIADAAVRNLKQSFKQLDASGLEAFAQAVIEAERTFVIGSGSMYWLAGLTRSLASIAVSRPIMAPSGDSTASELIADIGPRDVLLALSLAPYARQTIEGARFAREQGANVFALTDRRSSPLVGYASTVFLASTESQHYYPSLVAVLYVMETLLAAIATKGGAATEERLEAVDRARQLSGAYAL